MVQTPVSADDVASLCPELAATLHEAEPRWPVIAVDIEYAHKHFSKAVASRLSWGLVPALADIRLVSFLDRPPHGGIAEDAVGRWICGKTIRLVRLCPSCLVAGDGADQTPLDVAGPMDMSPCPDGSDFADDGWPLSYDGFHAQPSDIMM